MFTRVCWRQRGSLTSVGSSNPYEKKFLGLDCTLNEEDKEALMPFHDLDPDRLVIRGTGHWDATEFQITLSSLP